MSPQRSTQSLNCEKNSIWAVRYAWVIAVDRRSGFPDKLARLKRQSAAALLCANAVILRVFVGFVGFTSSNHFIILQHSHQMKQECHDEDKNATEAVGDSSYPPACQSPLFSSLLLSSLLLSSPGRYLQLDDNEFHLSMCCFVSSRLMHNSWITWLCLIMEWLNHKIWFLSSRLTHAPWLWIYFLCHLSRFSQMFKIQTL